jgi:hypothetical protein
VTPTRKALAAEMDRPTSAAQAVLHLTAAARQHTYQGQSQAIHLEVVVRARWGAATVHLWQEAEGRLRSITHEAEMDWHEIAMGMLTLVLTIVGWNCLRLFEKMDHLEEDMQEFRNILYQDFVQRDDYRADIAELKTMLGKIFDRLDDKVDKP